MDIQSRIQAQARHLTPADHRLLRVILSDPAAAAGMSISEVSRNAQVHEASAVRLARRLGYSGYPEMRADVQSDIQARRAPSSRIQSTLQKTGNGDILDELIHDERRSLARVSEYVDRHDLAIAADILIGARRVAVFAQGHAAALAELALRRLRRGGYSAVDLRLRGDDLAERLMDMEPQDVLLAFILRRMPSNAFPLASIVADIGMPIVLVSDQMGWTLSPRPNVILSAPRGNEDGYRTLVVPMTILNALILTIAARDDGRSFNGLERNAALARSFETGRP